MYTLRQDGCHVTISLDSFYACNPAVKTDCSGLQADEYVGVGVKAATGTGVTTPSLFRQVWLLRVMTSFKRSSQEIRPLI